MWWYASTDVVDAMIEKKILDIIGIHLRLDKLRCHHFAGNGRECCRYYAYKTIDYKRFNRQD